MSVTRRDRDFPQRRAHAGDHLRHRAAGGRFQFHRRPRFARRHQGRSKGSAERVAHIRRLADKLGYRPNVPARSFSEQRTKGVGLLYTDDAWVFEGVNDHVVQGIVKELRKNGHHLLMVPVDDQGAWEEVVLGGHVDGCLTFQYLPEHVRSSIRAAKLPTVLLGDNSDPEIPQIVVDDHGGAYAATRHLIAQGHRRIGMFVHSLVKPHCSIAERRQGYEDAMAEHGLQSRFWHAPEDEIIDVLVRGADRPTGLICYCDLESTLVMHAMWQYGLSVPKDLSVIGFNDIFATRYMTPPLTTVGFDAGRIGELGAQLVLKEINAKIETKSPKVVTVKTKLIIRGVHGSAVGCELRTGLTAPVR